MYDRLPIFIASAAAAALVFLAICLSGGISAAQTPNSPESPVTPVPPAALEAPATRDAVGRSQSDQQPPDVPPELLVKLEKALTDTTWTGQFTVDGAGGPPSPESYVIGSVSHEGGNDWLINAKIKYRGRDVSFPVPVQVRWAGRTPVITLDSVSIPPLGTFDARVLMRRGSYAGTWQHGKKGGHLFGKYLKIEPAKVETQK
jgi:hypothetical protein